MSTKIALFKEGEISQLDTPLDIYTNPIDLQAADFIGNPRINFVEGTALYDGETLHVKCPLGEYHFPQKDMKADEECPQGVEFECVLGVRPETVELFPENPERKNTAAVSVYAAQPAGSETLITITHNGAQLLVIQIGLQDYDVNQNIYATFHPNRMNVYNKQTTRLIKYAHKTQP
jgi:multiple sugar transport system ATP-binding protein